MGALLESSEDVSNALMGERLIELDERGRADDIRMQENGRLWGRRFWHWNRPLLDFGSWGVPAPTL